MGLVLIIQCLVITSITMLSWLLWSLSRVAVRLLSSLGQIFCYCWQRLRYIVNYKPACTQWNPQCREFIMPLSGVACLLLTRSTITLSITSLHVLNVENPSESSMVMAFLANSYALQLQGISLCPRYPLRHPRQSYIVLKFITLESNALIIGKYGDGKYGIW